MLTRNSVCQSLEGIPKETRVLILKALKMVWRKLRNCCDPLVHGDHVCVLSRIIVWLELRQETPDEAIPECRENLVQVLFGGTKAELKQFWEDHWECSPVLLEESGRGREVRANLLKTWCSEGDSLFLTKLLKRTLACPPFSSDTLEAAQIYNEVERSLGKRPIFEQDIRLVKSVCAQREGGDGEACQNNAQNRGLYRGSCCSTHAVQEVDFHKLAHGEDMDSHDKDGCLYADAQTCINAYESGYTIALRGLEFRCPQIAAIAEDLAVFFGQATVGANLYATPSNSQGFKPHHDDHCVFVWQLNGCKAWDCWSPKVVLPRLYSQKTEVEEFCTEAENPCRIFLKEGCLLYLPRGYPHAASTKLQAKIEATEMLGKPCLQCSEICTQTSPGNGDVKYGGCLHDVRLASMAHADSGDYSYRREQMRPFLDCYSFGTKSDDYQQTMQTDSVQSLHVTFGIEVEPPFDWEGFTHMSLHCWAEGHKWQDTLARAGACSNLSLALGDLYKGLLHVAIRQCGDKCSMFRKACLVAAQPLCEEVCDTYRFQSFFTMLLRNVAENAVFKEALEMVMTSIDTSSASGGLDWMHWLRHLPGKDPSRVAWSDPVLFFHERLACVFDSSAEGLGIMEVEFTKAKGMFIASASFAQALDAFISLLGKYRSVRKRFTKGLLGLHT